MTRTDPLPPALVDSHCHLDFPDFETDRADVIARAQAAGVTRMVTICTKLRSEPSVRAIAEQYDGVFYAAGTHPMSVAAEPMAETDTLIALAAHPKFVGIGETGLDCHYTADSAEAQKTSLRIHIDAARATGLPLIIHARDADDDMASGLPLIIHARDADDDMARILAEEYRAGGPYSCVMHCFSSGAPLARAALELGFYLSMSGIAAFPRSTELREIFAAAPVDRILVETDSPYLAPPPFRGRRNEPGHVVHTAAVGAGVFNMSEAEFAQQTSSNFDRLFAKAAAWSPAGGSA